MDAINTSEIILKILEIICKTLADFKSQFIGSFRSQCMHYTFSIRLLLLLYCLLKYECSKIVNLSAAKQSEIIRITDIESIVCSVGLRRDRSVKA